LPLLAASPFRLPDGSDEDSKAETDDADQIIEMLKDVHTGTEIRNAMKEHLIVQSFKGIRELNPAQDFGVSFLEMVKMFGDKDTPCNQWLLETLKTLSDAAKGIGCNCARIHAILAGAGSTPGQKCLENISSISPYGTALAKAFEKATEEIAKKCEEHLEKARSGEGAGGSSGGTGCGRK
jgi:hypothetical protein